MNILSCSGTNKGNKLVKFWHFFTMVAAPYRVNYHTKCKVGSPMSYNEGVISWNLLSHSFFPLALFEDCASYELKKKENYLCSPRFFQGTLILWFIPIFYNHLSGVLSNYNNMIFIMNSNKPNTYLPEKNVSTARNIILAIWCT